MGLMFFQDPLLNYFNTWCTYNTWMFNRGSWVVGRRRVGLARASRVAMMAEPLLTNAPGLHVGRPPVHDARLAG